jgi:chromate transporter
MMTTDEYNSSFFVRIVRMTTLNKNLFITFFKIGALTIGGGYAMIPVIERELVDKKHWLTTDEFFDAVAIAQAVPGIIALHMGIYLGYKLGKIPGAILSALGVILPSFLIMMGLASVVVLSGEWPTWLNNFFTGVRVSVVALIAYAAIKLFLNSNHPLRIPLAMVAFSMVYFTSFNPFWVILSFVLVSIVLPERGGHHANS